MSISLCSPSGPEREWQRRYNIVITVASVLRLKYLIVENVNLYILYFFLHFFLLFVTNRTFCTETEVGDGDGDDDDQEQYSEIWTIRITLKITLCYKTNTLLDMRHTHTHTPTVGRRAFHQKSSNGGGLFICDMGSAKCRRSTTVRSALLLCFIRGTFHYHRSCVAVNNNRVYRGR